jgi:proto-oncogene tyrosine-protein kinase Ret
MLKSNHSREELHDLLSEFSFLKEVSHPNVIRLLGACTSAGGPLCIIMEFARHGSLRSFLRATRGLFDRHNLLNRQHSSSVFSSGSGSVSSEWSVSTATTTRSVASESLQSPAKLSPRDVIGFAWQIAKGMSYLAEMKVILTSCLRSSRTVAKADISYPVSRS